jgi:hypothetical protein
VAIQLGNIIGSLPETINRIDPSEELRNAGSWENSSAIERIGNNREGQPAKYKIGDTLIEGIRGTVIEIALSPKPIIGDGPKPLNDHEKKLIALGVYGILRDAEFHNGSVILKKGDGVKVTINAPSASGCNSVSLSYTLIPKTGGEASQATDRKLFCSENPTSVIESTFAAFQQSLQAR